MPELSLMTVSDLVDKKSVKMVLGSILGKHITSAKLLFVTNTTGSSFSRGKGSKSEVPALPGGGCSGTDL